MSPTKMHDDEVETDTELVHRLLVTQHPQWADLSIERVASAGTDNAMYRLGDDLAVRLPRVESVVATVAKEQRWLPTLAPQLSLAVPLPVAVGTPDRSFPYPWSVVRWLPGDVATPERLDNIVEAALDLGTFVQTLQAIDSSGGPTHRRGMPIRHSDSVVRYGIAHLRAEVDADAVTAAWERVLAAPDHDGAPVWFHGDLSYLNLLAEDGNLTGVIDWGTCGVGDPSTEARIAWSLLSADARNAYRDALRFDDATWERGKGWVLEGVYGISYYRDTNPTLVTNLITAIENVLAESY